MKQAALLLLGGCSTIFGLASPQHAIDAGPGSDAAIADTTDAKLDIPDAAPGHCLTQADCPTSVCLPTTVCAAETDVAWLSSSGSLNAACTMAQPCLRLLDALGTMKPYIRVAGTIANLSSISRDVEIFGEPGAGFSGNLSLNNGVVGLYNLSFTAGNTCIQNQGATATIEHSVIHDCGNLGINSNGPLTLDASTVTNCRNGGVVVGNQTFSITNNFITQNGGGMTGDGGLTIQPTLASMGSRVDFNTIAANGIKSNTNASGGVFCDIAGFTLVGDVVVHNTVNGSTGASNANKAGQCTYASSFVQPIDNIGFVSTAANNYHITAQSPLRDIPGVATALATDVDGESRPYGSGYDLGADEYHP